MKDSKILVIKGLKEYQLVDRLDQISDREWIRSPKKLDPNYVERGIKGVVFILPLSKMSLTIDRWPPKSLLDYLRAYWNQADLTTHVQFSCQFVGSMLDLARKWFEMEHWRLHNSIFFFILNDTEQPENIHDIALLHWTNVQGSTNRSYKIADVQNISPAISNEIESVMRTWESGTL